MLDRISPTTPPARPGTPFFGGDFHPETGNRELNVGLLWKAIVRRRALFFAVFGVFVALVVVFTLLQPKTYTTQTKLIVGNSNADGSPNSTGPGTNLPILNALMSAGNVQTSATYAELIQQLPVARQVASDLHVAVDPSELLSKIHVRPIPDTSILAIAATWKDPALSARIANRFATVFVERERQLVTRQADGAIHFLQQQLPAAESRMRATQAALAAYQSRVNIVDLPTQTTSLIASQATLDAKAQTAEIEGRQAAASLAIVEGELAQTPRTIVGQQSIAANPVGAQIDAQIATLGAQLAAARQQYTDDYPTVIALRSQLAQAQRQKRSLPAQVLAGSSNVPNPLYQQLATQAATLAATVAASQAQLQTIAGQQAQARPALDRLPEQARRIADLQRAERSAQDVYDALNRKYQDATISETTAISDVTITQQAEAASAVKSPSLPLNVALGLVVGIALALAAVFIAEFFDDRFRTEEDVKSRLGLPVLATIPLTDAPRRKESAWVKPLSVEAFYQLVASLRYSSSTPPRTIAFTSPDQGDGKSTIAVNTALGMAMMKARVLVIDADLRRPSVHEKLGVTNDRGLSDVLVGMAPFGDVVKSTDHAGVSVLTSGRPAPNPVGLLQSEAFDHLLRHAAERYDYVIVDGPALRSIVDGVVLGNKTDGTVLVVNAQRSEGRAVASALEKLRGVGSINLLGVVLNGTRPDARDQHDYYLGAGQSISLPATAGE